MGVPRHAHTRYGEEGPAYRRSRVGMAGAGHERGDSRFFITSIEEGA